MSMWANYDKQKKTFNGQRAKNVCLMISFLQFVFIFIFPAYYQFHQTRNLMEPLSEVLPFPVEHRKCALQTMMEFGDSGSFPKENIEFSSLF